MVSFFKVPPLSHERSPSLPPPSPPLLSPFPVVLIIIILDPDRSQATYGDETAECVLETPQH